MNPARLSAAIARANQRYQADINSGSTEVHADAEAIAALCHPDFEHMDDDRSTWIAYVVQEAEATARDACAKACESEARQMRMFAVEEGDEGGNFESLATKLDEMGGDIRKLAREEP